MARHEWGLGRAIGSAAISWAGALGDWSHRPRSAIQSEHENIWCQHLFVAYYHNVNKSALSTPEVGGVAG
jgi:hypothetical protein